MTGTMLSTLGGGILGAVIKIVAGLFTLWLKNKEDERNERLQIIGKHSKLIAKIRPDPNSEYVSTTRRVLAWGMCFTFCAICLLWAIFPSAEILIPVPDAERGWSINLLLFSVRHETAVVHAVSTGAIVWSLLPFLSMILMTYFTPDISKIR